MNILKNNTYLILGISIGLALYFGILVTMDIFQYTSTLLQVFIELFTIPAMLAVFGLGGYSCILWKEEKYRLTSPLLASIIVLGGIILFFVVSFIG